MRRPLETRINLRALLICAGLGLLAVLLGTALGHNFLALVSWMRRNW
jgi:hypothetical protein